MSAAASATQATQPMIRRMNYFVLKRLRRQEWKKEKIRQTDYKPQWNLYVGDRVEIVSGQDRGKQGLIKQILHDRNRLVVEGLRLRKRAERATMARTGYYYMQEGTIHVSNVNLVDPETGKRTRIKIGKLEDNSRVRVAVKTNNIIPKPTKPTVVPVHHPVTDTLAEDVLQVTYVKPDYSSLPKKPLLPLHTLTTPQLVGSALIAKIQAEEAAKQAISTSSTSSSSTSTSESTTTSPTPSWYPPPHWNAATRRRMEFFRLKLTNGKPLNPVPLVTGSIVAHTIKKLRRAKEERMNLESRVRYFRWQKKNGKIKRIRGIEHMTTEQQQQYTSQLQQQPAAH